MITKRQLKQMLQSLTERVERLEAKAEKQEAKAELFDKGLEVCVDAHKKSLKDNAELSKRVDACERFIETNGFLIFALKTYLGVNHNDFKVFLKDFQRRWNVVEKLKEDEEMAAQTALKKEADLFSDDLAKEAHSWAGSSAVDAFKAGAEWGQKKKEDEPSSDNSNDGGQWLPLEEAKKKMGIRGNSAIDAFCEKYGLQRRVAAKSKGTIRKRWEVYVTPKKIEELSKRRTYRQPLSLYMRSAQVWAKFYGVSMRDFTPAMKRAGYMPGKDGKWRSKFLTPTQAKEIYEDIKSNATH